MSVYMRQAIGRHVVSFAGSLIVHMHRAGYRRAELWMPDLIHDPAALARVRGGVLVYSRSVGEMLPALQILRSVLAVGTELPVLFLVDSASCFEVRDLGAALVCRYVPSGIPAAARFLAAVQPRGLLISQEVHPHHLCIDLMAACARRAVPVAIINGFYSKDGIAKSMRCYGDRFDGAYQYLTRMVVRDETDAALAVAYGVPADRVAVLGDPKIDGDLQRARDVSALQDLAAALQLPPGAPVLLAGSTHAGEEAQVLAAFASIQREHPHARLILAPRNFERCGEVVKVAAGLGWRVARRTQVSGDPQVIVLDTMGELGLAYGLCTLAFVGGTLVRRGGHSLVEPVVHGKPVLVGPHVFNQQATFLPLSRVGGLQQVADARELAEACLALLADQEAGARMAARALGVLQGHAGALQRYAAMLTDILGVGPAVSCVMEDSGQH